MSKEGEDGIQECKHNKEDETIIPDKMGRFQWECKCGRRRNITMREYLSWGEA